MAFQLHIHLFGFNGETTEIGRLIGPDVMEAMPRAHQSKPSPKSVRNCPSIDITSLFILKISSTSPISGVSRSRTEEKVKDSKTYIVFFSVRAPGVVGRHGRPCANRQSPSALALPRRSTTSQLAKIL